VVAVIGTGLRRVRRCTPMVRCTAGRIEATPVRSWICISPSCGRRLMVVTVAIAVRRVMADRALRPAMAVPTALPVMVEVLTVATVAEVVAVM